MGPHGCYRGGPPFIQKACHCDIVVMQMPAGNVSGKPGAVRCLVYANGSKG
jgi:hypothetical protein